MNDPGIDLSTRYLTTNASFDRPFHLTLTNRGHYSEVNCLLAAMVYGLMAKRRLLVTDSDFEGLRWGELYRSSLPRFPDIDIESVEPGWRDLNARARRFWSLRRRVGRRYRSRIPLWNSSLGLVGNVFSISRLLADAFCQPSAEMPKLHSEEPYAAFHIRRGDKVRARVVDGVPLLPESRIVPVARYLDVLRNRAPDVRVVYVLTDDPSCPNARCGSWESPSIECPCQPP